MKVPFDNSLHKNFLEFYIQEVVGTLRKLNIANLRQFANLLAVTREKRGTIYCFGNGGSASIASHFAHNLSWDVSASLPDNQKFKAIALNEQACHITGVANDRHYDQIFVDQLRNFLEHKDLVVGISASGNSENIIKAIEYSKLRNIQCVTVTGNGGGNLAKYGDLTDFIINI